MSTNVEAVKAIYACFGRGDIPGILERLDPEIEWEHDWSSEPLPVNSPKHGRKEVVDFFKALADYDVPRFEPVAFVAEGDLVAVPIHTELRHKASGRNFRDLEMHLWTFGPDGLARRFRHFIDTRQFARTAGLS
jgi:uncharacterized protein